MGATTTEEEHERGEDNPNHLLDKIGGQQAMEACVEVFYEKLVKDETLQDFFENVDMERLKEHQRRMLTMVLTKAPEGVNVPKLMKDKHHRLFAIGLTANHFDTFAGHLSAALKDLQVHDDVINQIAARVAPFRKVFEEGEKRHLLDHIGGQPALEAAVDIFYERLVADKDLTIFFEGIDMETLKDHQRKFLTLVLTEAPAGVDVPDYIAEKHARLFDIGLNETHFDLVATHLAETLQGLQVTDQHINEVTEIVLPLRAVFEEGAMKARGEEPLLKEDVDVPPIAEEQKDPGYWNEA